jgi:hypothetical protein
MYFLRHRFLLLVTTLALVVGVAGNASAQQIFLKGTVKDSLDNTNLPFTYLALNTGADTTIIQGMYADTSGNFAFTNIAPGSYILHVYFFGYKESYIPITLKESISNFTILVTPEIQNVQGITVKGRIPPVEQKGDTTVYNASSFKTLPNADAEDLIKKMPGMTVKNGEVTAQGEKVTEIFVDGKPFFGDDPNTALKALPADIIDKIEVLDKSSDQSQFTGFDDGNRTKAINIVTKKDRRNGVFGKAYVGYGSDDRYNAGGNVNIFKGNQRITILGLSNNINQQNFSSQDLASIAGNSGGGRGRGSRGGREGGDFQTNAQNGITKTNSLGINFTDSIGKKINFTGSYFYNRSDNANKQSLNRNYFLRGDSTQVYKQNSLDESLGQNHRANFRIDYKIDSSNSILFLPRIAIGTRNSKSVLSSENSFSNGLLSSLSSNIYEFNSNSIDFRNTALYRHAFKKKGRTISFNLGTDFSNLTSDGELKATNQYYSESGLQVDTISQFSNLDQISYNISGDIRYTEPIGQKGQLMVNYKYSVANRDYDKETTDLDGFSNMPILNTGLSGNYESKFTTNEGGASYRVTGKKLSASFGADMQHVQLNNDQTLPYNSTINQSFSSVLPKASLTYTISKEKNIRIFYRSGTDVPSINQLATITDNSNPLLIRQGNPNLKQEFSNRVFMRSSFSNNAKYKSVNIFAYVDNRSNYIGNAIFLPSSDSVLANGYVLRQGSQLSTPTNLNGYWNLGANLVYSFPLDLIKSNIGLNTNYSYARTPGMINYQKNIVNNHGIGQGLTIGSNFSKSLDFTLGYSARYNIVNNDLQPSNNQNYFYHNMEFKAEYVFWKGFLVQSNIGQYMYRGLSSNFNQNFVLWNLGVGKKILKDHKGELRLSVYDILNQNNSITRNVTENYVEDVENAILNRYFMLTFTYNFSKFK